MRVIKVYTDKVQSKPVLLTKQQALAAFELFVQGVSIVGVKHKLCLPTNKVTQLFKKVLEIRDMIERIVLRKAYLVREESHYEIDEATGESIKVIDVEAVMCPSPQTLDKLHERSLELITKDYSMDDLLFEAKSIGELADGIIQVIDTFIKYSDGEGDATFEWWKQKVIDNE